MRSPSETATVPGSLKLPLAWALGWMWGISSVMAAFLIWLNRSDPTPTAALGATVIGMYGLFLAFAYLATAPVARSITILESGIRIEERRPLRPGDSVRTVDWSDMRRVSLGLGTVNLLLRVQKPVTLTYAQARAILTDSNCPITDVPMKTLVKLGIYH